LGGIDVIDTTVHLADRQIVLRDWHVADLARDAAWSTPGQRWKELDGPYYPLPTAEETAAFVARKRAEIKGGTFPHPRSSLAIADEATDEFLGLVSWYWESQETQWLSVGLVIYDPAYWGQGRGYLYLCTFCLATTSWGLLNYQTARCRVKPAIYLTIIEKCKDSGYEGLGLWREKDSDSTSPTFHRGSIVRNIAPGQGVRLPIR